MTENIGNNLKTVRLTDSQQDLLQRVAMSVQVAQEQLQTVKAGLLSNAGLPSDAELVTHDRDSRGFYLTVKVPE